MKQINGGIIITFVAVIILIMAMLLFAFRKILTKRRICVIIASTMFVALLAIGVTLFYMESSFGREYLEDLRIELTENDGAVIIREWTFLQGGGAEIYYKNDGKETLIGKTTADDGYCPFQKGQYTFDEQKGKIIISWAFVPSDDVENDWQTRTFTLE